MTTAAQPQEKPAFKKGGLYHRDDQGQDTLIERTKSISEAAAEQLAENKTRAKAPAKSSAKKTTQNKEA